MKIDSVERFLGELQNPTERETDQTRGPENLHAGNGEANNEIRPGSTTMQNQRYGRDWK
jgi:hypothetical protein